MSSTLPSVEGDGAACRLFQTGYRAQGRCFSRAVRPTGMPGQYVPLKETLRGFKMILNGECDSIPESCFLFAGTIDDVLAKAKQQ